MYLASNVDVDMDVDVDVDVGWEREEGGGDLRLDGMGIWVEL
jgi:hypothetical protein